jgi:hypothetical protein
MLRSTIVIVLRVFVCLPHHDNSSILKPLDGSPSPIIGPLATIGLYLNLRVRSMVGVVYLKRVVEAVLRLQRFQL